MLKNNNPINRRDDSEDDNTNEYRDGYRDGIIADELSDFIRQCMRLDLATSKGYLVYSTLKAHYLDNEKCILDVTVKQISNKIFPNNVGLINLFSRGIRKLANIQTCDSNYHVSKDCARCLFYTDLEAHRKGYISDIGMWG